MQVRDSSKLFDDEMRRRIFAFELLNQDQENRYCDTDQSVSEASTKVSEASTKVSEASTKVSEASTKPVSTKPIMLPMNRNFIRGNKEELLRALIMREVLGEPKCKQSSSRKQF